MKTILVIYHSADFDGIFCREIAKKYLGDDADYLGWNYGDPVPEIPPEVAGLYLLDISIPELMRHPGLIWIDHHRTAMDLYPQTIPGWRIDGVAACRLAWHWFFEPPPAGTWPTREDFVERRVSEPDAVRLAGEYDIWDRRDPNAELFQHGLRSEEELDWNTLLLTNTNFDFPYGYVLHLLNQGRILQSARAAENKSIITKQGFELNFEGLRFIACNAARYNSHLFTAGLKPEHDGCLGFNWNGHQDRWTVSLYGVPGKPEIDLSAIAKKYGGGGHRQACGFTCKALPFDLGIDPTRDALKRLLAAEQATQEAPEELPPVPEVTETTP